jgi:hypothetical protein
MGMGRRPRCAQSTRRAALENGAPANRRADRGGTVPDGTLRGAFDPWGEFIHSPPKVSDAALSRLWAGTDRS